MFKNEKKVENVVPVITIKIAKSGSKSFEIESHILYFKVFQSFESIDYLKLILEDNSLELQNLPHLHIGATILASIKNSTDKKDVYLIEAEIIKIENSYGDIKKIEITGCSKLYRVSRSIHSGTYLNLKVSDIVKKVVKRSGLSCSVEATSKKYDSLIQINESDYSFIKRLALFHDYRIFMKGKKLCFKPATYYKKGKIHQLHSGYHFIECSVAESKLNLLSSVEVMGFDVKKKQNFSVKVVAGKEKQSIDGELGSKEVFKKFKNLKTELLITDANPIDKDDAKIIATSILNRNNMNYMSGHAIILGDPSLQLDSLIELIEFGTKRDGKYHIKNIYHEVLKGFYTTHIEFFRNVYNKKENKKFIEAKTKPVKDMKLKTALGPPVRGLSAGLNGELGGINSSLLGKIKMGAAVGAGAVVGVGAVALGAGAILASDKLADTASKIKDKGEDVVSSASDKITQIVDDTIATVDKKLDKVSDTIKDSIENIKK